MPQKTTPYFTTGKRNLNQFTMEQYNLWSKNHKKCKHWKKGRIDNEDCLINEFEWCMFLDCPIPEEVMKL